MMNGSTKTNIINNNKNNQSTTLESSQGITYFTPTSLQNILDDRDVEGYGSERTIVVRLMVSKMCYSGADSDDSDSSDSSYE